MIRKPQVSTKDPNPALAPKLMGALLELGKANIKAPIFHEDMQLRLATPRGQMVLPVFADLKNLTKMEFISKRDEKPDVILRYRVFGEKTSWIVDFQVTKEGQIYSIGRTPDTDKK